jgi:hypothetical protein
LAFYLTNGCAQHAEIELETENNGRQIEDVYMGMGRRGNRSDPHNQNPDAQPDRDYDPSESREIILDRKPRFDNVEMPDWIEIIPPRKPN